MAYVIGQTIETLITIQDVNQEGILGLTEADFDTLEAFNLSAPATTATVAVTEVDEGQYILEFVPTVFGSWALHYIYDDTPDYTEDTIQFAVASTAAITVVTSGGTWTYTGDMDDPIQEVRFIIQDVDGSYPLFSDTEVSYALGGANGVVRKAAATLVERLMARYAAMADTTELDLSVRASQIYDHYKALLLQLQSSFGSGASVVPYAGGISQSDIAVREANTDRTPGIFDKQRFIGRDAWGGIRH